jgi:hypothetical protein
MSASDLERFQARCMAAADALSRLDIDHGSRILIVDALAEAFAPDVHPLVFRALGGCPPPSRRHPASIRAVRRTLLDLRDGYDPPDEDVLEQEALARVMDAWDEYEYAAGTAEGCGNEVVS